MDITNRLNFPWKILTVENNAIEDIMLNILHMCLNCLYQWANTLWHPPRQFWWDVSSLFTYVELTYVLHIYIEVGGDNLAPKARTI